MDVVIWGKCLKVARMVEEKPLCVSDPVQDRGWEGRRVLEGASAETVLGNVESPRSRRLRCRWSAGLGWIWEAVMKSQFCLPCPVCKLSEWKVPLDQRKKNWCNDRIPAKIQCCFLLFELGRLLMTVLTPQVQDQRAVRSFSMIHRVTISVTFLVTSPPDVLLRMFFRAVCSLVLSVNFTFSF